MPDGSVVELNAGAKIETHYSTASRRVTLLAGEAHFEVVPDAARPFFVEAGGVAVRAVGTAFSVNLERNAVVVLVTHGRVSVSPEVHASSASATAETPPRPLAVLEVGQRVVVDVARQPVASDVTTPPAGEREELLAWRAPRVTFTGVSLAEAVSLLNRESSARQDARFVIADASLAEVRISGLFRLDNTEAFVRLLDQGFGIVAEPRGAGEILLRRGP
ncbi:MAG: FecR domain-containing protein [Verrucomicrobia bacterium]|nr:FecR domain-containing protein [Verrucomicrobiota bacterium]